MGEGSKSCRARGRPSDGDRRPRCRPAPPDRRAPEDLSRVCVHEAGHVVMYVVVGRLLESVTTVVDGGRWRSDGRRRRISTPTAEQLEETARILLAGRAAEGLLLGSPSTARKSDLARATATVGAFTRRRGWGVAPLPFQAPEDILPLLTYDAALRRTVEATWRGSMRRP